MPQLSKEQAESTKEAESSFAALPEGLYIGVLSEVTSGEGPAGEYWSWRFTDLISLDDEDFLASGSLWINTSLSDAAAWKLNEVFQAFGADPSVDTDTLLGQKVRLAVSQRVIERGARKGEVGNQVDSVYPIEPEDE